MNNRFYDRNKFSKKSDNQPRLNFQIRALTVRLVQEGRPLGIFPIDQARKLAADVGLDLVEIAAGAQPPVCEIKDFGKWKFEEKIKEKEAARKQRDAQGEVKEIRLRPGIADHDVDTKVGQAKKFIEEGKRVQFNLQFKGQREMSHKECGFAVIDRVIAGLVEVGTVEKAPKLEGNRIICRLSPKE